MFKYERMAMKKAWGLASRAVRGTGRSAYRMTASLTDFVNRQVTDPAVRRALLLAFAAYLLRHAPFLDQDTAEKLSDEALVVFGVILSKMKGTAELQAQKAVQS